jgi:thiamine pyrophosphate-dependent acetolactate synthase large subunit-like protein
MRGEEAKLKRGQCISILGPQLTEDILVITGTGNTAYQLAEYRRPEITLHSAQLGACSAIAFGLAVAIPNRKVIALDGDGNLLFNLAVLGDIANKAPRNLGIVVFDNASYESAGRLPTATAGKVNLTAVACACGIENAREARNLVEFSDAVEQLLTRNELALLVAKVETEPEYKRTRELPSVPETTFTFARHIERLEGRPILSTSTRS